ncbi:MAG: beta-1,6-N-acetylglucosaminyltransferase [Algoriphagus sp.]|uniref:beta-1,6-N-acetylglucosaminyltransferase n=1 Tax=Algoriphagus sp. TaxID=1872435 RepID=UPI00262DCF8A|nr:beta-1,6-N-acetylglucosaminyltransferase [Algoriphagus sp.]MDG1277481.1 beta-1,6-N-acetylglucosaminyltransferase [Algoriphagus sp.]
MNKHAILLVAYRNIEQIYEYIDLLDEDFYFYIHVDKKSNISKERIEKLRENKNVKFVESLYKVNWGGKKFIEVLLFLAKEALKDKNIKYLHTASESDLPLKSPKYIKEFFIKNDGKQFLDIFSLPDDRWPNGGLDRFDKYHFYDQFNAKTKIGFKLIMSLLKLQDIFGINRKSTKKMPPLYGGSTWLSLSYSCMEYAVNFSEENLDFMRLLENTFAPEEIYFQTVLMQSPYRNDLVNKHLFYIDWEFRNGNSPAHLDVSDLEKLKVSEKLFVRKIQAPISDDLKAELIKYLKTK